MTGDIWYRVKKEHHYYVADFFTKDGTFIEELAVPVRTTNIKAFREWCDVYSRVFLGREW